MPRRSKTPPPILSAPITQQAAPPAAPLFEDAPAEWTDLLGEVGEDEGAEIHVYTEPEKGQPPAWCFTCTPEEFPKLSDLLTHIKQNPEYGPGAYRLKKKVGTQWHGFGKRVVIAGRKVAQSAAAAPAAVAPVAAQADKHTEFLQSMVLALIGRPVQESKGSSMMEVVEVAKLLTDNRKERTPVAELRELFGLAELVRPKDDGNGGGGDDGDDWLGALVKSFAPAIAALATAPNPPQQPKQLPASPMAALPHNPPPRPAAPAPQAAAPTAAGAGAEQGNNPLRPFITILMRGAVNDSDPASYAEVAIDMLGEHAPMLLGRPDLLDLLCNVEPAAADHRAWFAEVIAEAVSMLNGDGDAGDGDAGGGDLTGGETHSDGSGHAPAVPLPVA